MKEFDIRPRLVFEEYLRLAAYDADLYFRESVRSDLMCPACNSKGLDSFQKHSFNYQECPSCQTLYVSPRPPASDFFKYYQESASANYFATTFYKSTEVARRERLWRPKAEMVLDILRKRNADNSNVVDIGGGYGIFAEEYYRLTKNSVAVIEPGPESAKICREKGLRVIQGFLEEVKESELPKGPRAFVSFELFEHLHDCNLFLRHLRSLMNPGDLFIFTTLSGMGVDIQALWSESNSISLQHLNFFNPKAAEILLERNGFEIISIETPGKLDLDILRNNSSLISDRFWKNFILQVCEENQNKWQEFISLNGFSSHMWVVCQRPWDSNESMNK